MRTRSSPRRFRIRKKRGHKRSRFPPGSPRDAACANCRPQVRELPTAGPRIADRRSANRRPQGRELPTAGLRIRLLYGRGQNSKTPLRYRPQGGRRLEIRFAAGRGVRELLTAGPRDAACADCRPQVRGTRRARIADRRSAGRGVRELLTAGPALKAPFDSCVPSNRRLTFYAWRRALRLLSWLRSSSGSLSPNFL